MINKDGFKYEIKNNAAYIWAGSQSDSEPPFIFQDRFPGGNLFSSEEEVVAWVEQFIYEENNPMPLPAPEPTTTVDPTTNTPTEIV